MTQIKSLYQTKQVRELDRIAIEEFKIPGITLMQRAGEAAFKALQDNWPKVKKVLILCGKGNNAGDGYVVAKLAHEKGFEVEVQYLAEPGKLTGDALTAAQKATGITIKPFNNKLHADVIVDALLGSGLQGEVRGEYKKVIKAINAANIPVLAIDIPSGLDADTGNALGIAVKAAVTITFVGCKQGLFTGDAPDYCGKVLYNDLNIPKEVFMKLENTAEIIDIKELKQLLPPRKKTAHKGDFGHVLVIGGDYGMAGAARMAGEAAARVGAGWVTVATRPEHVMAVSGMRPELMCYGIKTKEELQPLLAKADVIILGPGLGQSAWSKELWQFAIATNKPKVVDADGLNLLAQHPCQDDNWILTPHPGEAARLLNCSTVDIQQDRFAAIQKLHRKYHGTCILKGAGTLVLGSSNKTSICTAGNPGMASGGMGDVLSGIIGGLIAQHLSLENAAHMGVILHATAADLVAAKHGERGMLALDLLTEISKVLNSPLYQRGARGDYEVA